MAQEILTQEQLKELLHYSIISGKFYWKDGRRGVKNGSVAGTLTKKKYIAIMIGGSLYFAHRLAFLYVTGSFPEFTDHSNHCRSANMWVNISDASLSDNQKNKGMESKNTSGITGVSYDNTHNKWSSRIYINGETLGLYWGADLFEACCRRISANTKYGFHENHGARI